MELPDSIINIGIIAHVDAGKTTLTENILYLSGAISKKGRVDSGDTQTDSLSVERRRGISVKAAATSFTRNGVKINLIDTPGHVDFIAEVERSLSVLDGAVLVISSVEGLQSQTRILMDTIMSLKIPAAIFINKIDRVGANPEKIYREANAYMRGRFVKTERIEAESRYAAEGRAGTGGKNAAEGRADTGDRCPAMEDSGGGGGIHVLSGDEFISVNIDALCSLDDNIMAKYVNDGQLGEAEFIKAISRYTKKGELYPVFYGSALYSAGVEELLDRLPAYLPASNGDGSRPLSGVAFKVDNSGREKRAYVRLYDGCIRIREMLKFGGKEEKVTRLARLENGKTIDGGIISAGDIGVLYIKDLRVGDILGEARAGAREIRLSRPTVSVEVQPVQPAQKRELYEALAKLADEDPLLSLSSVNKLTVRMFGEIQTEILQEVLLEQYGIPVGFLEAKTIYMETPAAPAAVRAPMGRNGTPFRAGVGFRVEPLARGSGLVFATEVSFGNLEKTFQAAVEEAVYNTCKNGVYGWEVTDAKVTFDFSQYDSVTSTPSDYRDLTPPVLMEAFAQAGMDLLEPVYWFELRVPGFAAGKALYDCERMRAVIEATEALPEDGGGICISGLIPADTCKNYAAQTASYTEGRGLFITKFHGYRNTEFDASKVNEPGINIAANKAVYLLHKLGAR